LWKGRKEKRESPWEPQLLLREGKEQQEGRKHQMGQLSGPGRGGRKVKRREKKKRLQEKCKKRIAETLFPNMASVPLRWILENKGKRGVDAAKGAIK